ncbi:hypothetical protein DMX11_02395 [Pseudomonas sp. LB-090624]|nr:hypothetical protein DMX11_02395 [Pseudomonas sp. LB-090624]
MGTAPHITGRVYVQVNRFSLEHAPPAEKTPVWLRIAPRASGEFTMHACALCKRAIKMNGQIAKL